MTASSTSATVVRSPRIVIGALVVGVIVGAIGWKQGRHQFFASYLVAWLFWTGLSLGSLALQLLHNLTGGKWGEPVRPYLRAASGLIPVMGLLFIPIALNVPQIYEWADPAHYEHDAMLQYKRQFYLNVGFFQLRTAIYFAIWITLLAVMAWQGRTNAAPGSDADNRFRRLSGIGLGLHGLCVTFAAIDWMMSLEPHWFSAIYGVIIFSSQGLAALAFSIFIATRTARRAGSISSARISQLHDLGKLMSGFIMFWTYVQFSQMFIIWYGNLPEEVVWVERRLAGYWLWVALSLLVFHFAVPFFGLLSREWKRNPARLGGMALLVVVMEWVMYLWYVGTKPNCCFTVIPVHN